MFEWVFRFFYALSNGRSKPRPKRPRDANEYLWLCPSCRYFEVSSNTASVFEAVIEAHKEGHRRGRF